MENKHDHVPEHGEGHLVEDAINSRSIPDTDVVLVHGIHGNGNDDWPCSKNKRETWLKSVIFDRLPYEFYWIRCLRYCYSDDISSPHAISKPGQVKYHAMKLLESLHKSRKEVYNFFGIIVADHHPVSTTMSFRELIFDCKPSTDRPIIMVSNDIGGLIVKQAFAIASLPCSGFDDLKKALRSIIFFGCPHRAPTKDDMDDNISRLLFAADVPQKNVVKRVQTLSDSAIQTHRAFLDTKLPLRITLANIFSTDCALQRQIFDRYSATMDLPFEIQVGIAKPHMDLTQEHQNYDHTSLQGLYYSLGREPYPIYPDYTIESLPTLLMDSSPLFPRRREEKGVESLDISGMGVFQEWMNRRDACILYIYGNEISKLESATWQVYDALHDKRADKVIHFKFDSSDHRFRTVRSMLSTILSQLTSRYYNNSRPIMNSFFSGNLKPNIRSEKLLFMYWMELLLKGASIPTTYLLSGLDQCKEPVNWFLNSLVQATAASEMRFKIAITSVPIPATTELLKNVPMLSVDSPRASSHNISDGVAMEYPPVSECRPLEQHSNSAQIDPMDSAISGCDLKLNAPQTAHTETSEEVMAGNETPLSSGHQAMRSPSANPETEFQEVMSTVPSALRPLCRSALALLAGSFEPLTWTQIRTLLGGSGGGQDLSTQILDYLRPFTSEKEGSIRLKYPIVRVLSAAGEESKKTWYNLSADGDVHAEITMLCMSYLCSDVVKDKLSHIIDNWGRNPLSQEMDAVVDIESPLWYATARWPDHYRLAAALPPLREKTLGFFGIDNEKTLCHWAELYSYLSNPETLSPSFFSSPLTIASGLGIGDLLDDLVDRYKDDLMTAITEAARNDHLETYETLIRKLKSMDDLKPEVLEAAQMGGTRCLSKIIMNSNLAKDKDSRPPSLLYLVTLLGITEPIRTLVGIIKDEPDGLQVLNQALHAAVLHGDRQIVEYLVENGADVNSDVGSDETHLLTACIMGHVDVCKLLLREGARTDADDESPKSPLAVACTYGKHKIVETLCKELSFVLRAGLETGEESPAVICVKKGFTKSFRKLLKTATREDAVKLSPQLLRYAVRGGYVDICRDLLEINKVVGREEAGRLFNDAAAHDNVDLLDLLMSHLSETGTAGCEEEEIRKNNLAHHAPVVLSMATRSNTISLVDYVLERKPDARIEDLSSVLAAISAGYSKIMERLIGAGTIADLVCAKDGELVQEACDSVEMMALLLDANPKPDINLVTRCGTALQVACSRSCSEVVELLLENGANPNPDMGEFDTVFHPLVQAVSQGSTKIVRMLLEAGADVNARTSNEDTPLHYALYSSEPESNDACLRALLEFSPKLDPLDRQEDTPLNSLVGTTPVLSVRLLLNAGANPELPNSEDCTPIFRAIRQRNFEVAQFLIKKGVRINFTAGEIGGPIHLACKENSVDLIDVLIKHGADVNLMAAGFVGTPLQAAFSHWEDYELQKNIVKKLLDAGADVNRKGGRYGYAINFAFLMCPPEIVQLLFDCNVDVDVEDRFGRNPAHLASLRTTNHVSMLKNSPQLFRRKDRLGRNALHYAVGSGRLDVVKKVFEICGGDVDIRDEDDWTPLMWAARCHQKQNDDYFGGQGGYENEQIIQFLVEVHGADTRVRGRGWDREWSPLKLARYHGASQTIQGLLSPRRKDRSGSLDKEAQQSAEGDIPHVEDTNFIGISSSDKEFHRSRTAREHQGLYCDSCLYSLRGVYFRCLECSNCNLCFKCYMRRDELHEDQLFEDFSDDYESVNTQSEASS